MLSKEASSGRVRDVQLHSIQQQQQSAWEDVEQLYQKAEMLLWWNGK